MTNLIERLPNLIVNGDTSNKDLNNAIAIHNITVKEAIIELLTLQKMAKDDIVWNEHKDQIIRDFEQLQRKSIKIALSKETLELKIENLKLGEKFQ